MKQLTALLIGLVLFVAAAYAADTDIVPEKTRMVMQTMSYDSLTGILHGYIAGPAGNGNVTVQMTPETKVRKARLGSFVLNTPLRTIAEAWNYDFTHSTKVVGPVATSPLSAMLSQDVAQQGFLTIQIEDALYAVKKVSPYYPKTFVDNTPCQPTDMRRCCTVPNGADYTCVLSLMYSQDAATHDSLCMMAGGIPTAGDCSQSGTGCSFFEGSGKFFYGPLGRFEDNPATANPGGFGMCTFQVDDPSPFKCASQFVCSTEYLYSYSGTCADYGGMWTAVY